MKITFYHYQKCSTSQQILKFVKLHADKLNIDIVIRLYCEDLMNASELDLLAKFLKINDFRDLIKKNGLTYRNLKLKDKNLSSDEMREIILSVPKLLKRPIIVCEDRCLGIIAIKEEFVLNFFNDIK